MQFCNVQFRYRVHWIAAEKREIWALYWPRSWPRRRVQHLAIVKYMERNRVLFLHCGLFYYCSLFSVDLPPSIFLAASFELAPSARDRLVEPVTGGGYLRLWFSADSQEKREERKEETRGREATNRKRKPTATSDRYIRCPISTNDRFL